MASTTNHAVAGGDALTDEQAEALIGLGLLSGVTYDSSNRAISWTIDTITYTANYSSNELLLAGSDGTITRISVDPAQRITGITLT